MVSKLTIPPVAGSSTAFSAPFIDLDRTVAPDALAAPTGPLPRRTAATSDSPPPRVSIDDALSNLAVQSIEIDRSRTASLHSSVEDVGLRKARADLLKSYRVAINRPLNLQAAVDAFKLRAAAQVYCDKSDLNRFLPELPLPGTTARLEKLKAMKADEVIAEVQKHPGRYSRTLLTDLANYHFITSLNIDYQQFIDGVKSAAKLEPVHTMIGRGITFAASALSAGATSAIPGADSIVSEGARHVAGVGKKALKFIGRQLPSSVVNPIVTGKLRINSSVMQLQRLAGGTPSLAPGFGANASMQEVAGNIEQRIPALVQANGAFRNACSAGGDTQGPMRDMVDAYLSLHDAANDQYKRRIGVNRTQTYGKAYGAAINGVASAGGLVSVAVPGPGTAVGLGIQGACLLLQAGAGYLDKQTEQTYNIRANLKWGDFLTEEAKNLPFTELRPEHIDENRLRRAHVTAPELHLAAIREVYPDDLGQLMARQEKLSEKLEKAIKAGRDDAAVDKMAAELTEVLDAIDRGKHEAGLFESLDPQAWKAIPAQSVIGKCLDDASAAYKAQKKARHRQVGEVERQVLQRYAQAAHMGLSSGVTMPIGDALTMVDGLHVEGDADKPLVPQAGTAVLTLGGVGGAVSTAVTGEVRAAKADSGRTLRQVVDAKKSWRKDKLETDAVDWTFEAAGKRVDLRTTQAYDKLYHTPLQRATRIAKAVGPSLMSGPKALVGLAEAKLARREARHAMADTIALLESHAGRDAPRPLRARNFSAMKEALHDHPQVAAYLQQGAGSVASRSQPPTIDLDLELEQMQMRKAAKKAAAPPTGGVAVSQPPAAGGSHADDITDAELSQILWALERTS
jgi:hypothetical protein